VPNDLDPNFTYSNSAKPSQRERRTMTTHMTGTDPQVSEAKSVLVLKRGKGKGFSGVENDLFVEPKTSMLFGDARQSLLDLGLQVKGA
jgi:NAD/NADP transhydrogenase beta subunit